MSQPGSAGNVIAAIASFFFAGLGQLVQGRIIAAIIFCLATYISYGIATFTFGIFLIVALPLHLWCIIDAARFKAD
ncbi:hypothetical protein [Shewanella benthica]|uniref:Uncharacterized protein n=1 Tax=Shewanella benthica KT99 TaxID=314608 RepID=A9DB03_9GAMM|nr:hypothetical protein [Shewanella benthica]EDQ00526.1 hypothetical protein KT99_17705 [Shewanella benthica KT99]